ncbi:Munc13 homology 1 [Arabidopsis thaliana x Arabidopsis arenosa]|uniref:Munc13 homology 1 n=1 Tax=Arabidopsis thaliana x Arabidopsis arenosa TaxID=1240361 RepID=A0A8T1YVJ4_9BRAS|nr:Munc13 homology 1 [Arabidopsis thaliana x Arabidopsis arenosa]
MEEENAVEILQRYRRDRRKLLDFMLAGSLIKKVIMPPGAVTLDDVDLDQVSVDYVINCAKKGGMLELAEAIRDYHDHIGLPYMNSVGTADEFFLATNPESSGSPPKRAPPPIPVLISSSSPMVTNPEWCESPTVPSLMRSESIDSPKAQELTVDDIEDFEDDDDLDEVGNFRISRRTANDAADFVPKLPSFATGITDDDLRETAFEILLACAGASGGLIVPSKEKKKEKSRSRLIKKLGRKSESVSQSQNSSGLVALLEMMRGQMEISEAMDIRTRQGLLNALAGKVGKRMDSLLVPLELLCCVSRTEFSDKKAYLRWQKRQLNMLAEGLINNPVVGFGESGRKATDLKSLLLRIEESESLPSSAGEVQRAECLKSLREVAISLAERPARGDLTGEVCHWADGYHLNVRLYEKLLLCVFDILNDGKLTEEVEEILELLKSMWRVLGITETIHYTCYAWVLFRQGSLVMEDTVTVAMITWRLLLEESDRAMHSNSSDREQIESYILSSIKNTFTRMSLAIDRSDRNNEHHLALLAEETKKLMKKDSTIFMPILSQRHPQAIAFSASLVHKLYGNKLKPFLDGAEHLTEDAVSVFPAADSLEQYLLELMTSVCGEDTSGPYFRKLIPYEVESLSGTLVLRWINSQLGRILSWVERAFKQEHWDPISPQQRHGSSIVEVFRIVEETVDQFFALKVPMRSIELSALFRGIDNAFQVYTNHVMEKLASKDDLVPPVPVLTRYKKETAIKVFVKKELFESKHPDERRSININVPATAMLCVQLNTLHYAVSQLSKLEDSMWDRWIAKKPREKIVIRKSLVEKSKSFNQKESFEGSRKDINAALDRICEFTGTKIIFCDLREPFIENLYKPSVSQSRLEGLIEALDTELGQLCSVIMEPLRDRIVTSLLQASLDGLLRVLLDGGPSRVFHPSESKLLEEDVEVLKEFFISGGDGLPRGVVENQVARVRLVVKLHGYETRELIDDLRSRSSLEMQQGGKGKLGADTQTLVRVLCHRNDSEASQFLKKQYKIPKSHG